MPNIAEHLAKIEREIALLNQEGHVTETDEFVALTDLEISIHEVRKVFERRTRTEHELKQRVHHEGHEGHEKNKGGEISD